MNIDRYGKVVNAVCDECVSEVLDHAFRSGPPPWLDKDEDGDFTILVCDDYEKWREGAFSKRDCFAVETDTDTGTYTMFTLCPGHLKQLAERVLKGT